MTIFEKIVAGEIPCKKVLENDDFLAFEDINPRAPIHVLVIPKTCYASFEEFPAEKMQDMSKFIKEVTKKLNINKDGYRMITNIGENGCQEVKHLHFHILGGKKLEF